MDLAVEWDQHSKCSVSSTGYHLLPFFPSFLIIFPSGGILRLIVLSRVQDPVFCHWLLCKI